MEGTRDSLIDLERHKRALEDNIAKLHQALRHWQTWDVEYEALKEEVDAASTPSELQRIQADFEGELVTGKELKDIFGSDGQRSGPQVINVLDRRIDYVTKNIETLQQQLLTAENKLAGALVLSQPDAQDEEGQPITEIIEELDDDDNVVSYKLNRPGESLGHIQEALEKAGVKDLPELSEKDEGSASASGASKAVDSSVSSKFQQDTPKPSKKKGVSFAEDVKPESQAVPDAQLGPISRNAARVQRIMDSAKEQEKIIGSDPAIPENEDPEDAALRKEMLEYSMGEVGAVVAELQIEEGDTDGDDYEFEYTDEEMDEDDDDFDMEDQYGRYTGRVITDDYRARMLELEQKLGVKSRFTAKEEEKEKEAAAADDSSSDDERIGRIVVNHQAAPATSSKKTSISSQKGKDGSDKKKGVRFAESLDIASEDKAVASTSSVKEQEPKIEPLSDVIERSPASKPTESKPARKTSRFKNARGESSLPLRPATNPTDIPVSFHGQDIQTAPTGPDGKTIADTLVERETSANPIADDGYDDFSEVALEHQRLRRKFINSQGGFLKDDRATVPADEDDEGQVRQSRFKAARLSRQ